MGRGSQRERGRERERDERVGREEETDRLPVYGFSAGLICVFST